jgi:hypothetical protein
MSALNVAFETSERPATLETSSEGARVVEPVGFPTRTVA